MGWMIFLAKEKDIGEGCSCCRFRFRDKCLADKRVDIHEEEKPDKITDFRPYKCPFRYYDAEIKPITDRFHGMTKEETKGYFEGADHQAKRYARLEEERDRYVESWYRESKIVKGK